MSPLPARPPQDHWLDKVYTASSAGQLSGIYDEWAPEYDTDLQTFGYRNTALVAALVCRHLGHHDGPILDAGCGTGLMGDTLSLLGYGELVGIDASPAMLRISAARDVYTTLREMVLGERLDFADGTFGATLAVGVLTVAHAPPAALDELVRVTRPGGRVIFTLTEPTYEQWGFREKLLDFDARGVWSLLEETPRYYVLPFSTRESDTLSRVFVYDIR